MKFEIWFTIAPVQDGALKLNCVTYGQKKQCNTVNGASKLSRIARGNGVDRGKAHAFRLLVKETIGNRALKESFRLRRRETSSDVQIISFRFSLFGTKNLRVCG